jgi:hypothetical protein
MKSERTIVLVATDVEKIINDLSLLVVSMDRIGSSYHDKPRKHALEVDKFLLEVKAFELLAKARGILTEAYNAQSSEAEVARSEEEAESLPYWKYKRL